MELDFILDFPALPIIPNPSTCLDHPWMIRNLVAICTHMPMALLLSETRTILSLPMGRPSSPSESAVRRSNTRPRRSRRSRLWCLAVGESS